LSHHTWQTGNGDRVDTVLWIRVKEDGVAAHELSLLALNHVAQLGDGDTNLVSNALECLRG
jgi:hypothetical protein